MIVVDPEVDVEITKMLEEIERKDAEIAAQKHMADKHYKMWWASSQEIARKDAEIANLESVVEFQKEVTNSAEAENAKLRAALEKIVDLGHYPDESIARHALEQEISD